jgi:perosamine synthetase
MIPIAKPLLDEQEADAVRRVILTCWITQGPEVAAFERDLACVGSPHACAVSNCTTALYLAERLESETYLSLSPSAKRSHNLIP